MIIACVSLLFYSGHLSYCMFKRRIQTRPCSLSPGHLGIPMWTSASEQEGAVLSWYFSAGSNASHHGPFSFPVVLHLTVLAALTLKALLVCWTQRECGLQVPDLGSWEPSGLRNGQSSELGAFSSDNWNEFSGLELHQQPSELQWKIPPLRLRCTFHWGAWSCLDMLAPPAVDD